MYLKRLELAGFKSFAQKTTFDFPAGIAAVVGPNGSGKSNIIDAVRWLLGERESKSMRSLKADDLIFAGNEKKSRMSLAQATMVFDNRNKFFPVDYAEVSIRRRLERDGTSQYFLNDAEVRLKDIIDFFAKSRLGTRGFSIVNQGDSDLFVRSSPKERRAMLEEILGLRQFQLKKHDADLKLKATKINMEKARALIEEITPHLRILRRQTARWEKHDDLLKELRELETDYFSARLKELEEEQIRIEPTFQHLAERMEAKKKELVGREAELKLVNEKKPKAGKTDEARDREARELHERRSVIERELGKLEAKAEIMKEESSSGFEGAELVKFLEEVRETIEDVLYEANLVKVKNLLKTLFEKINHFLEGDSSEAKGDVVEDGELDSDRERLTRELSEIAKKIATIADTEREERESLKGFSDVFKKTFEAVEAKRSEIAAIETERNRLSLDRERIRMRREELDGQAKEGGRRLDEFSPSSPKGDFDAPTTLRHIFKLRGELAGMGDVDAALVKEAEETEARFRFLSTQIADLEKAFIDLTKLTDDLDRKIHDDFAHAMKEINAEFQKYFRMMFGGGQAKLTLEKMRQVTPNSFATGRASDMEAGETSEGVVASEQEPFQAGIEIGVTIPAKRVQSLDMLSGGEKTLVSIAVLFALISVSPPPFLVLDEIDAALDEANTRRFGTLIRDFAKKTQFVVVTHNRATMEAADIVYGITMGEDGASKVLSLKLE
ncbi:MAG: AAA family ATPase [Patescibacteria group bacterium]